MWGFGWDCCCLWWWRRWGLSQMLTASAWSHNIAPSRPGCLARRPTRCPGWRNSARAEGGWDRLEVPSPSERRVSLGGESPSKARPPRIAARVGCGPGYSTSSLSIWPFSSKRALPGSGGRRRSPSISAIRWIPWKTVTLPPGELWGFSTPPASLPSSSCVRSGWLQLPGSNGAAAGNGSAAGIELDLVSDEDSDADFERY